MNNLFGGISEKIFYVWVDEDDFSVKHNLNLIDSIGSIPTDKKYDPIPFIPNPNLIGFMTPFIRNMVWEYKAEYNLEQTRRCQFQKYPSRFTSLFLFETIDYAKKYARIHPEHVHDRSLKQVITHGAYLYSKHDLGWIDVLYLDGEISSPFDNNVMDAYWMGIPVQKKPMSNCGKPYMPISNYEILYCGSVKPICTIE